MNIDIDRMNELAILVLLFVVPLVALFGGDVISWFNGSDNGIGNVNGDKE